MVGWFFEGSPRLLAAKSVIHLIILEGHFIQSVLVAILQGHSTGTPRVFRLFELKKKKVYVMEK